MTEIGFAKSEREREGRREERVGVERGVVDTKQLL